MRTGVKSIYCGVVKILEYQKIKDKQYIDYNVRKKIQESLQIKEKIPEKIWRPFVEQYIQKLTRRGPRVWYLSHFPMVNPNKIKKLNVDVLITKFDISIVVSDFMLIHEISNLVIETSLFSFFLWFSEVIEYSTQKLWFFLDNSWSFYFKYRVCWSNLPLFYM